MVVWEAEEVGITEVKTTHETTRYLGYPPPPPLHALVVEEFYTMTGSELESVKEEEEKKEEDESYCYGEPSEEEE